MSISAATLQRLVAVGLTQRQMVEVAAILAEAEQAEEQRKQRQRDRKARSRDKSVTEGVTVTGLSRDGHSDNPSPKETPPAPPKEITPSSLPEREKLIPNVAPSQASGAAQLQLVAEELPEIPGHLDRRPYPEAFEHLWSEYKPIASPNSTKADSHRAWAKLSAADREACWTGLVRYAVWVGEENARRSAAKRPAVEVKHLATFINRRGWEPFLEEVA